MDWVLMAAAATIAIGFIFGVYRGAIKIAVSLLTTMVTLVLVTIATPYVANAITEMTPLGDMVQEQITDIMANMAVGEAEEAVSGMTAESVRGVLDAVGVSEEALEGFGITIDDIVSGKVTGEELADYGISSSILDGLKERGAVEKVLENVELPRDQQMELIEEAPLPAVFKSLLKENNNSEIYEELGAETFVEYLGGFLTKIVIHIVSFLCTFILVVIILRAIIFALNIVSELPVLGFVNRLAGGAIGVVCALVVLWVLCLIITLLYVTPIGKEIYDTIQGNGFLKMIYDYNPVLGLATKL